jgi:hypothetical protein
MSIISIVQSIYQRHGLWGFYAGLLPKCLGATIHGLLLQPFCQYIYSKLMDRSSARIAKKDRQEQGELTRRASVTNMILSSTLGYLISCFLLIPFDTISTRMQIRAMLSGSIPSSLAATKTVLRKHGLHVFCVGAIPQVIKYGLNAIVVGCLMAFKSSQ